MKFYLFLISFLFTSNATASTFEVLTGTFSSPFIGGVGGCWQNNVCKGSVYDPEVWEGANDDPNYTPTPNDNYFYVGPDLVLRTMGMRVTLTVYEPVKINVTWNSFDLYQNTGYMQIAGEYIDLQETPSGSFEKILDWEGGGSSSIFAMIYTKANSLDSFAEWEFTYELLDDINPIPEVPLPASLFMLAPALISFLGFRRKRS